MISIVICSINENYLSQVTQNITATIGVEFELLVWNNVHQKKGLCEVYNRMAEKAKFDLICFVHEDIIFETNGWGQTIVSDFSGNENLGVIGVAGSRYKSSSFSGWFSGVAEFDCARIIHRHSSGDREINLDPSGTMALQLVVCVDGVFIAARKNVWEQIRFDDRNLTGFHFYDIDFSLRASRAFNVAVTYAVLITHITKGGDFSNDWLRTAIRYHEKEKGLLPHAVAGLRTQNPEKLVRKSWLNLLKHYRITWKNKWSWIRKQQMLKDPSLYYDIVKFLLYQPLGLKRIHKRREVHE